MINRWNKFQTCFMSDKGNIVSVGSLIKSSKSSQLYNFYNSIILFVFEF